jgi:hypothetical protein
VIEGLRTHPWLGNVRELQNVIERAVILSTDKVLRMPLAELKSTQRIGKIKHLFSTASPVPSGACPRGGCLVGLVRGGGTSGRVRLDTPGASTRHNGPRAWNGS